MEPELCRDLENTMLVAEERMRFEEMLEGKTPDFKDGFTELEETVSRILKEPKPTEYYRGAREALLVITYTMAKLLNEPNIT